MDSYKRTTVHSEMSDVPEFQRIKLRPIPEIKPKIPQPSFNLSLRKTSSTTKTTSLTAPAKLYGKDLSEYDEVDVDALLAQLSPEEINILAKEVDPDDNFLPPDQRCSYECTKSPTGPLDRKKLIEHINKQALETPDQPEFEPYVKGTVRGKKWIPPPRDQRALEVEEQIAIDMGDEYEQALSHATQEEIIDLAAILGFHSMMNQDQYHASLLNKGQPVGLGWDGITKSTQQKVYPMDPPNNTDVEESIKRVKEDDPKLIELNFNNIKNISDEKFEQLFEVLPKNEHLEVLSLTNVGLTDKTALLLAEAIEKSKTLRVLNVETNFISPPVVVKLVKALLKCRTIEEFRASNQRSAVLGNKIEMEITDLVEKNTSLLRLGLHLEFNDARHRVAAHLQRNIDRIVRVDKIKPNLPKLILPPGNIGMDYETLSSTLPITPSPTPSPIPRVAYEVEEDPDNMVIRGTLTPSPSPSPSPSPLPPDDYEVEVDPDNMIIRGGGNNFELNLYNNAQLAESLTSLTSSSSTTSFDLSNDLPAYNEDLISYKAHITCATPQST
ncbi:tropomodulin isoform 3-T4 [Glossina fuscipes fuscipes]